MAKISPQVFDLLQWEGKTYLVISEFDTATDVADRLIDMAKNLYGETSVEHADSLAFAANAGVNFERDYRSRNYLENALEIYLETVGENDSRTARARFDLAKQHLAWDRHERAIEYFSDAINVWSMEKEQNLIEIGTARSFLVTSYSEIGAIEKATEQCKAIALEMADRGGGEDDAEVAPLYRTFPEYPKQPRPGARDARVQFSFTIDENGFVKDIEVEEATGHKQFQRAAEEALKEWRYAPAVVNGEFVPRYDNQVTITFELES